MARRLLSAAALVGALAGCGGDGSGAADGGPLNPGLDGTLVWIDDAARPREPLLVTMDLASGRVSERVPASWAEVRGRDRDAAIVVGADGHTVLEEGCAPLTDGRLRPCVHVQDTEARTLFSFVAPGRIDTYALRSPDGRHAAAFASERGAEWLQVYESASGALVDEFALPFFRLFAWIAEGRLLLVGDDARSFYVTRPFSADVEYTLFLPDAVGGEIDSPPEVSRDGRHIAFGVDGGLSGEGRAGTTDEVWVLTLRSREDFRFDPVAVFDLDDADLTSGLKPRGWSPDGSTLLVTKAQRGGLPPDATPEVAFARTDRYTIALPFPSDVPVALGDAETVDGPERGTLLRRYRFAGNASDALTWDIPPDVAWVR